MMHYFQRLWPNGTFFTRIGATEGKVDETHLNLMSFQVGQFGGSKVSKQGSGSFEEQLEAVRRASDIKKMLFGEYIYLNLKLVGLLTVLDYLTLYLIILLMIL